MTQTASNNKVGLFTLSLGALGVVYGDIGTSILYSVKEIFFSHEDLERNEVNVLGSISLIIWILTIIITIKYIFIVLRADNEGEGGAFSLLSLVKRNKTKVGMTIMGFLVLSGALLFGEGIITPAISVTSAVEGLAIITPSLQNFIVPITIIILFFLFFFQSKGTHKVGRVFGPILLAWFAFIAILGVSYILQEPSVLKAFNPYYALKFIVHLKVVPLFHVLGSVMLVITGGEALYADMGHFGKTSIRISWFSVVFPCLILGYLGQGAFLLSGKEIMNENIFYSMVPSQLLIFSVILATCATIIASQALISGIFSLVSQGVLLGLIPRLKIIHTHHKSRGQIYLPFVNWMLFVGCVGIVLGFRSSNNMAAAYGLTVSLVILLTTIGCSTIAYKKWGWNKLLVIALFTLFGSIELTFIVANSLKFLDGAYVPIILAAILYLTMNSWEWGKKQSRKYRDEHTTNETIASAIDKYNNIKKIEINLAVLAQQPIDSEDAVLPPSLVRFLDRFEALPKRIVFISAINKNVPRISKKMQWSILPISEEHQIESLQVNVGFMDETSLAEPFAEYVEGLDGSAKKEGGWVLFSSRERLVVNPKASVINKVRFYIYRTLYLNAQPAYTYYGFSRDKRVAIELIPAEIG